MMGRWVEVWMVIRPMNFLSCLESDIDSIGPEVNKEHADFSAPLSLFVALQATKLYKPPLQANTTISILKSCVDNITTW